MRFFLKGVGFAALLGISASACGGGNPSRDGAVDGGPDVPIDMAAPDVPIDMAARDVSIDMAAPDVPIDQRPGETGTETFPRGCHHDCFGFTECRAGVVTRWAHTPVPCEFWTGECPHATVGTCKDGCAVDSIREAYLQCPMTICRENFPKRVGDACETDADCLPTVAETESVIKNRDAGADVGPLDGGVRQTYLRCDPGTKTCVERAAPTVPDWLGPCDSRLVATLPKGGFGVVADPSCSGGVCIFSAAHEKACVDQGCSRRCSSDDECPQGAVCQNDGFAPCDAGASLTGYCKPGPENSIGFGLTCR